ncbi:uncharacterized protein [Henckelia pumila]|uniref:uncharacterized protein n=1 Tax=Henckelia pumila TaxID=405737 RepID=UPI003C6E4C43
MKGSSSTTASSENQTPPAKCFSGILRGLLCTGSLPTHPSEHFNIESCTTQNLEKSPAGYSDAYDHVNKQEAAKPGVVARLMGLDSLPASPLQNSKTLGSYFRSRSVNSIDFLSQLDPCPRRHRRVRTSVSFREVPSPFDKFSVVFPLDETAEYCCGEGDHPLQVVARKTTSTTTVIYEKGRILEKKSRNAAEKFTTVNKKVPAAARKMANPKKDLNGIRRSVNLKERRGSVINKPAIDSRETRPTVKKIKKVHGVKKIHPEPTGRRGEASHEICSKKHSLSQKNGEIRAITKSRANEKKFGRINECGNVLEEVFRLTQESVDEINWDRTDGQIFKFEDFEDICVQFGGQILQVLLIQIVDELVLLYGTRN